MVETRKKPGMNSANFIAMFVSGLLWATSLFPSALAQTSNPQEIKPAVPKGLLAPWRTIGIDPSERAKAKSALAKSLASLERLFLNAPNTLSDYLGKTYPVTLNAKRIADRLKTGSPKTSMPEKALTMEPVWCSILDYHLLFIIFSDTERNTLLASSHGIIKRNEWENTR